MKQTLPTLSVASKAREPAPTHQVDSEVRPRVLVVDDEEQIRDILVDFLVLEGFNVEAAANGRQALSLMEQGNNFDLVLSDLKMPVMGGLELAQAISERKLDVVTILMTGFATVETAITGMQHGAYDYITKPFKVEEIPPILRRGLEKHRLERENVQLRELVRLYQLSELISSGQQISNALERVAETVASEFRADVVLLFGCRGVGPSCGTDFDLLHGRGLPDRNPEAWTPTTTWLLDQFRREVPVCYQDDRARAVFPTAPGVEQLVSFLSVPMKVRGDIVGMFNLYSFTSGVRFNESQRRALFMFASHAAAALENARMYHNLRRAFAQTIEGFARALEAKDRYTAGHSDRVATYAVLIADGLAVPPNEVEQVRHAALLHDIGKLGIRSEDLNKPQKLTQAEYVMFQSHPSLGARILEPLDFLHDLIPAVAYHHEQWDGSGYPEGLEGDKIPVMARIIAVADTYDAMTSDRAYRKALPHDIAMDELRRCASSQFDPGIVDVFGVAIERYRSTQRAKGVRIPR